ncbi:MAG TPA: SDR family NAD(P)-dependent oxidoreductase, partial [Myxococcota bacterium]|nr:SDR family NAD(P)-dependent oxidoreductase [Myxococcota bacterium]
VLQVSSIGAYQPCPTYASYGAAKSFVLHHGEALDFELRPKGVTVTVISPGVTATEFLEVSGQEPTMYQRMMMMDSPTVARVGVDAALAGKRHVIPGVLNWLAAFSVRFVPRRVAVWMAWMSMRPDAVA